MEKEGCIGEHELQTRYVGWLIFRGVELLLVGEHSRKGGVLRVTLLLRLDELVLLIQLVSYIRLNAIFADIAGDFTTPIAVIV